MRHHGGAAATPVNGFAASCLSEKSGWVSDRRCGLWMYYSLAEYSDDMQKSLAGLLRNCLTALPGSATDRERLAAFIDKGRCA